MNYSIKPFSGLLSNNTYIPAVFNMIAVSAVDQFIIVL